MSQGGLPALSLLLLLCKWARRKLQGTMLAQQTLQWGLWAEQGLKGLRHLPGQKPGAGGHKHEPEG